MVKLGDRPPRIDAYAVLSLSASLVAALGLSLLLFLAQARTGKPSDFATLYLLASVSCDVVLLTLPSGEDTTTGVSSPVIVRLIFSSALVALQTARDLRGYVAPDRSPEESSGLLSRVLFTWINPSLVRGYKNILTHGDLPHLRTDMKPELTRDAMIRTWEQRGMISYQANIREITSQLLQQDQRRNGPCLWHC